MYVIVVCFTEVQITVLKISDIEIVVNLNSYKQQSHGLGRAEGQVGCHMLCRSTQLTQAYANTAKVTHL